jgi:hypothetical protein
MRRTGTCIATSGDQCVLARADLDDEPGRTA